MVRRWESFLLVSTWLVLASVGCEKRRPGGAGSDDPAVTQGLALIETNPEGALEALAKARNPSAPAVLLAQGLALEAKKEWGLAEDKYRAAARSSAAPPAEAAAALARVQLVQGRFSDARTSARQSLQADPRRLWPLLLLGVIASTPEEAKEALNNFDAWSTARQGSAAGEPPPAEYFLLRASVSELLGRPAQAEADRKAAATAPLGDRRGVTLLMTVARLRGNLRLALGAATALIADGKDARGVLKAGELAYEQKRPEIVEAALKKLPALPKQFDVLLLRGRHLLATGHPEDALAPLREATQMTTDREQLVASQLVLAEALFRSAQQPAARSLLEKVLESQPQHREVGLLMARFELAEGDLQAGLARLAALAQVYPESPDVLSALGDAQSAADRPGDAAITYQTWARLPGQEVAASRRLYGALLASRRKDEAAAVLQVAFAHHPTEIQLLQELAAHYFRVGQPEQAVLAVQNNIPTAAKPMLARLLLAEVYHKLDRQKDAYQVLQKLTEEQPDSSAAHVALGHWYERQGDLLAAIAQQEQASKLAPADERVLARLATLYQESQQISQAAQAYLDLLRLADGNVVALNNAAYLFCHQLGQAERGVELAERAQRLSPAASGISDTLAYCLVRRARPGDAQRAVDLLRPHAGLGATPELRYHFAAALILAGNRSEGTTLLATVLKTLAPGQAEEEWVRDARKVLDGSASDVPVPSKGLPSGDRASPPRVEKNLGEGEVPARHEKFAQPENK